MHVLGSAHRFVLLGLVLTSLTAAEAPRPARVESRPAQAVTIDVIAKRFEFVPKVIEVVEGDQVTLAVKSADGTHGFEIKKLKVKKEIPKGGEVVTLSFTAPAPGDYEIACSEYCGRGHRDMKARLVVKPRSQ